jgi:hypothetical protein
VAEDQVRELGDREDEDEVEEQLEGGRPLRRTLVSRAQVAGRWWRPRRSQRPNQLGGIHTAGLTRHRRATD